MAGEFIIRNGFKSKSNSEITGSLANGLNIVAVGLSSHAEGRQTTTNGNYSHAEGNSTTTNEIYSHAEGHNTVTYGIASHTEGFGTFALGNYSHAEGADSVAVGEGSHAEGHGTITSGSYQLAVGSYNTRDNSTSIVIIGNGADDSTRSDLALFNSDQIIFSQRLTVTSVSASSFTGSLLGSATSASYSNTSTSASYALTSSYSNTSTSASYAATASLAPLYLPLTGGTINGNVTVNGTASVTFLNVTYESASVIYSSGSNQFGDASNDIQTLYGSIIIPTGSLTVIGSVYITGSTISTEGFTGSLQGTSSYATTASYALTAQTLLGSVVSASYAATASYLLTAISSTSGVEATPTSSLTASYTHDLGRIPSKVRIYGMSQFTSNAAATPTPFSIGNWTSSGNRCIYQPIASVLTTTVSASTSTTFAVAVYTAAGSFVTGRIQNVGATAFDIVWAETGAAAAKVFMWEAE